jgi:hypothetical protein
VSRDLILSGHCNVYDDVAIWSHLDSDGEDLVEIMFGDEQLTLGFFEVAAVERLRDVAAEAALLLRARITLNEHQNQNQRAHVADEGRLL